MDPCTIYVPTEVQERLTQTKHHTTVTIATAHPSTGRCAVILLPALSTRRSCIVMVMSKLTESRHFQLPPFPAATMQTNKRKAKELKQLTSNAYHEPNPSPTFLQSTKTLYTHRTTSPGKSMMRVSKSSIQQRHHMIEIPKTKETVDEHKKMVMGNCTFSSLGCEVKASAQQFIVLLSIIVDPSLDVLHI